MMSLSKSIPITTVKTVITAACITTLLLLNGTPSKAKDKFKVDWLSISDKQELDKTWNEALVYLPEELGGSSGRLMRGNAFDKTLQATNPADKWPLILFLHYCEGLGHHREDMKRLSKLGFIVIAPDSFAREHRPLGCYEDRQKFIRYFDAAVAFQKAELDFAVQKLGNFNWIDRDNLFLFGSGMGGLVAAHYEGNEFAGHLIEGWGCRGPNPIFDGIWAPPEVRIFVTVSKNTPFLNKNEGFSVDCEPFLKQRKDATSVVLDRPAHQVSWYPKSYQQMIRFLMRDRGVEIAPLLEDKPDILKQSADHIHLREKWSDTAVYEFAKQHCAKSDKKFRLTGEVFNGEYKFKCVSVR